MMHVYEYTKQVNPELLKYQMEKNDETLFGGKFATNGQIQINGNVNPALTTVRFLFEEELILAEQNSLATFTAAHVKTDTLPHYKIFDFISIHHETGDKRASPADLDFKTALTLTLAKKVLPKVQGKPTAVEYYESYDIVEQTYNNLICRIDFTLTYDSDGFITCRKLILKWYYSDDTLGPDSKDLGRCYDPIIDNEYRIKEGKKRRESIVNGMLLPILGGLIETEVKLQGETDAEHHARMIGLGRGFLSEYDDDFRKFIGHSDKVILTTITNATDSWLDNEPTLFGGASIRAYVLSALNI